MLATKLDLPPKIPTIGAIMHNIPLPKKPGDNVKWGNLSGASLAYELVKYLKDNKNFSLIVTHDPQTATQIEQELKFFGCQKTISHFPDWETLPYDIFSPHQDIISQRIACLSQLLYQQTDLLIIPISTLMHFVTDLNYIAANSLNVKLGDKFNTDAVRRQLQQRGYYAVNQVVEHGEYAIRGAIMDIFPTASEVPFRIELFDDEIESIRTFDTDSQLSIDKVSEINLLPAREFPLDDKSIEIFRTAWRDTFAGNPMDCPIYQQISQGMATQGIEYYLPLFFEKFTTLFDFLPQTTEVIRIGDCYHAAGIFWDEVRERYQQSNIDRTRPLLAPEKLFLNQNHVFAQLNQFKQLELHHDSVTIKDSAQFNFTAIEKLPDISVNHKLAQPMLHLQNFLNNNHHPVLLCAESSGRKQSLLDMLTKAGIETTIVDGFHLEEQIQISVSPLIAGFIHQDDNMVIITENELFGEQVFITRRKKQKQIDSDIAIKNLAELQIDAPVVHVDHGIGRFKGLQSMDAGGITQEYLIIAFAGADKLYVPVTNLHLIGRYSGMDSTLAPLHKLGNQTWDKAKQKAAKKIRDVATELLALYAKREAKPGFAFKAPDREYERFAASFPFEETPDQAKAIDDVLADMQKPKPMDRLVCGDVGFGKTEVAMRAAFLAVQSGKQVAIFVPTTLLAEQHYQNFLDRFSDWPINIACLTRFRTTKQSHAITDGLISGQIDIVIGTHKLIQKNIKFNALGLLVIDEEHRFGVSQKEKIKAYRTEVDILTLTATPIPRTLNMSLSGIRELSLIATPPAKRLSVKTFVHERNKTLIREAILREILRGGQVYYLHNEVKTIENVATELKALVPEASINIGHGQMSERELEHIISDFYHQRFNVLICTTIIETGIDIPTANTIVIDDADHFGVAQLHQLRGRVGRSHHQAYAYLMVPSKKHLTRDAKKRLEAVSAHDDLGVGFILATHDLEIRGAGDLLGEDQSGNIQDIGFNLYMDLLDRTIAAIKSGKEPSLSQLTPAHTEVDLKISALIPDDYLHDIHQRLILYKRLANADTEEALIELKVEIIDRFGALPIETQHLIQCHQIRLKAKALGIRKVETHLVGIVIEFDSEPKVEHKKIIELIQTQPQKFRLDGANRLRYCINAKSAEEKINLALSFLDALVYKGS